VIASGGRARHWHRRAAAFAATLALPALFVTPVFSDVDGRLAGRLDHETAAAVGVLVDQARERGLPTEPLVARVRTAATIRGPVA